ncbi:MAG: hypothetical protein M1338_02305 [Patescibacteria group bacterium]|nr:hypothetical protein [Patescibacteria group bacterium]
MKKNYKININVVGKIVIILLFSFLSFWFAQRVYADEATGHILPINSLGNEQHEFMVGDVVGWTAWMDNGSCHSGCYDGGRIDSVDYGDGYITKSPNFSAHRYNLAGTYTMSMNGSWFCGSYNLIFGCGYGGSNPVVGSTTVTISTPPPPTNFTLRAEYSGCAYITLMIPNAPINAMGYVFYRSETGLPDSFSIITPQKVGPTTWNDSNISPDKTYYYYALAINANGSTKSDNTLSLSTIKSIKINSFTASPINIKLGEEVTLQWSTNSSELPFAADNYQMITDINAKKTYNVSGLKQYKVKPTIIGANDYTLSINDGFNNGAGCTEAARTITINVSPAPSPSPTVSTSPSPVAQQYELRMQVNADCGNGGNPRNYLDWALFKVGSQTSEPINYSDYSFVITRNPAWNYGQNVAYSNSYYDSQVDKNQAYTYTVNFGPGQYYSGNLMTNIASQPINVTSLNCSANITIDEISENIDVPMNERNYGAGYVKATVAGDNVGMPIGFNIPTFGVSSSGIPMNLGTHSISYLTQWPATQTCTPYNFPTNKSCVRSFTVYIPSTVENGTYTALMSAETSWGFGVPNKAYTSRPFKITVTGNNPPESLATFKGFFIGSNIKIARPINTAPYNIEYDPVAAQNPPPGFADLLAPLWSETSP